MKYIKSLLAIATVALLGSSAWATYSSGAKISMSPGASISINEYYNSSKYWYGRVGTSNAIGNSSDGTDISVSPQQSAAQSKWFTLTVNAKDSATIGASSEYAYARNNNSGSNGTKHQVAIVNPLRIKVGDTKSNVAASGGQNTWRTGETDSGNYITVTAGTSGSSRNVSIKGDKVGDATCWMTNKTTSAGYYAYKVYVYEEGKTDEQKVFVGGKITDLTFTAGKAGEWGAKSSNESFVKVTAKGDSGTSWTPTIEGIKVGSANITVSNMYYQTTFEVTVKAPDEWTFDGKTIKTTGAEKLSQTDNELVLAWKSGTGSLILPDLAIADILVVGGGGGAGGGYTSSTGSSYWGDAGSAGEVKELPSQELGVEGVGGEFAITVGTGGAGGVGGSYNDTTRAQNAGKNGGESSIGIWTAAGGVGGQSRKSDNYNEKTKSIAGCGASDLQTPGSAGIVSTITGETYGEGGAAAVSGGTATPAAAAANSGNGGDAPINPGTKSTGSTGADGGSGIVIVRITSIGWPVLTRTVSADGNWTDAVWTKGTRTGQAWTDGRDAEIAIDSGTTATLTVDKAVSAGKVTITGAGNLTIANAQNLSFTELDDSGVTGTITFEFTSSGELAGNAISADWISRIRAAGGNVTFRFKGSEPTNGFSVDFGVGDDKNKTPLATHLDFASGKHKMTRGVGVSWSGTELFYFGTGATDDNSTLLVENGVTLELLNKNLSYAGEKNNNETGLANMGGVIRVNDGGTLNFTQPSSGNTFNYHQRLYLEPGSTTTFAFANNTFQLWGGTNGGTDGSNAQIYVPAGEGEAVIRCANGNGLQIGHDSDYGFVNNGLAVFVGAGSKLKIDSPVLRVKESDSILKKFGAGEIEITGACAAELEMAAGILALRSDTSAVPFGDALTIADGVALRFPEAWPAKDRYALCDGELTANSSEDKVTIYVGTEEKSAYITYPGDKSVFWSDSKIGDVTVDRTDTDEPYAISQLNADVVEEDAFVTLKLKAGTSLSLDAASRFVGLSVECAGELTLTTPSGAAPDDEWLAKIDLSGVTFIRHAWYPSIGMPVIAVNFNGGEGREEASDAQSVALDVDMYGSAWFNAAADAATGSGEKAYVYDTVNQEPTDSSATLSWNSKETYKRTSLPSPAPFMTGYLDDGNSGASVTLTDIPFMTYDVIVYSWGDGSASGSISVNGTNYTASGSSTVEGDADWGDRTIRVPRYGANALRINGLSGDLSIQGGTRTDSSRGPLSAFVVVKAITPVATPTAIEDLVYDGTEQAGVAPSPCYTIEGGTATDAGNYTATVTLAEDCRWADGSTDPTKTVAWSIAKRPVTVKADDADKIYGAKDPDELTATVTGTVGDDKITYTVTREEGEDADTYVITASGETDLENYTVAYETGTFTIGKATPTIETLAASQITEGATLAASTLTGSATRETADGTVEVKGAFTWDNPETKPSAEDSETTPFAVTFTPEDTANINPVELTATVEVFVPAPQPVDPMGSGAGYAITETGGDATTQWRAEIVSGADVAKAEPDSATGADFSFQVIGLKPGRAKVRVSKDGLSHAYYTVTIVPTFDVTIDATKSTEIVYTNALGNTLTDLSVEGDTAIASASWGETTEIEHDDSVPVTITGIQAGKTAALTLKSGDETIGFITATVEYFETELMATGLLTMRDYTVVYTNNEGITLSNLGWTPRPGDEGKATLEFSAEPLEPNGELTVTIHAGGIPANSTLFITNGAATVCSIFADVDYPATNAAVKMVANTVVTNLYHNDTGVKLTGIHLNAPIEPSGVIESTRFLADDVEKDGDVAYEIVAGTACGTTAKATFDVGNMEADANFGSVTVTLVPVATPSIDLFVTKSGRVAFTNLTSSVMDGLALTSSDPLVATGSLDGVTSIAVDGKIEIDVEAKDIPGSPTLTLTSRGQVVAQIAVTVGYDPKDGSKTVTTGRPAQFVYENETGAALTNLTVEGGAKLSDFSVAQDGTIAVTLPSAAKGEQTITLKNNGKLLATYTVTGQDSNKIIVAANVTTNVIYAPTPQSTQTYYWSLTQSPDTTIAEVTLVPSGTSRSSATAASNQMTIKAKTKVGETSFEVGRRTSRSGTDTKQTFNVLVYETKSPDLTVLADGQATNTVTCTCTSNVTGEWIAWSDDPAVAKVTVSGDGQSCTPYITGVKKGETTLHVENDYCRYTIAVKVENQERSVLTKRTATVQYRNPTGLTYGNLTVVSGDANVATGAVVEASVAPGATMTVNVCGETTPGETTLTVKSGETDLFAIDVTVKYPVTDKTDEVKTLYAGEDGVTITYANDTGVDLNALTVDSDDPTVATGAFDGAIGAGESGVLTVTGLKAGTVGFTVKNGGKEIAKYTVMVVPRYDVAVNATETNLVTFVNAFTNALASLTVVGTTGNAEAEWLTDIVNAASRRVEGRDEDVASTENIRVTGLAVGEDTFTLKSGEMTIGYLDVAVGYHVTELDPLKLKTSVEPQTVEYLNVQGIDLAALTVTSTNENVATAAVAPTVAKDGTASITVTMAGTPGETLVTLFNDGHEIAHFTVTTAYPVTDKTDEVKTLYAGEEGVTIEYTNNTGFDLNNLVVESFNENVATGLVASVAAGQAVPVKVFGLAAGTVGFVVKNNGEIIAKYTVMVVPRYDVAVNATETNLVTFVNAFTNALASLTVVGTTGNAEAEWLTDIVNAASRRVEGRDEDVASTENIRVTGLAVGEDVFTLKSGEMTIGYLDVTVGYPVTEKEISLKTTKSGTVVYTNNTGIELSDFAVEGAEDLVSVSADKESVAADEDLTLTLTSLGAIGSGTVTLTANGGHAICTIAVAVSYPKTEDVLTLGADSANEVTYVNDTGVTLATLGYMSSDDSVTVDFGETKSVAAGGFLPFTVTSGATSGQVTITLTSGGEVFATYTVYVLPSITVEVASGSEETVDYENSTDQKLEALDCLVADASIAEVEWNDDFIDPGKTGTLVVTGLAVGETQVALKSGDEVIGYLFVKVGYPEAGSETVSLKVNETKQVFFENETGVALDDLKLVPGAGTVATAELAGTTLGKVGSVMITFSSGATAGERTFELFSGEVKLHTYVVTVSDPTAPEQDTVYMTVKSGSSYTYTTSSSAKKWVFTNTKDDHVQFTDADHGTKSTTLTTTETADPQPHTVTFNISGSNSYPDGSSSRKIEPVTVTADGKLVKTIYFNVIGSNNTSKFSEGSVVTGKTVNVNATLTGSSTSTRYSVATAISGDGSAVVTGYNPSSFKASSQSVAVTYRGDKPGDTLFALGAATKSGGTPSSYSWWTVIRVSETKTADVAVELGKSVDVVCDSAGLAPWSKTNAGGATVQLSTENYTDRVIATITGTEVGDYDVKVSNAYCDETIHVTVYETATGAKTVTYGGTAPELSFTSGKAAAWTASSLNPEVATITPSGSSSTTFNPTVTIVGAGTTTLFASNKYYRAVVTLVVNPKPVTVTATATGKEYGETDPELEYVASDAGVTFTGALVRAPGEDVGTYAIGKGSLAAENCEITFVSADFTISKAKLVVKEGAEIRAASDLMVGDMLGQTEIEGTLTYPDGTEIEGVFTWADPTYVLQQSDVGVGKAFAVLFTPKAAADQKNFDQPDDLVATVTVKSPVTPIPVPTAVPGLIYNGNEQTGVVENVGFTLTGNVATNAGSYTATATLADGYIWADGSSDPTNINWSIAPKPIITIHVKADEETIFGVYDGEGDDVANDDLELPAETTEIKLELEALGLTVPVFKVVRGNVTNVTTKVATYAIADGDTLEFFAEEADETDPTVTDDDIKTALIESIDDPDPETREAAAEKVNDVVGTDAKQVSARDLATYIDMNGISSGDIADCDYVAASVKLNTDDLITEENTEVEFTEVEAATSDGFVFDFELKIDDDLQSLTLAQEYVAGCIQTTGDLGTDFAVIGDPKRVAIDPESGKVTITPDPTKSAEFFKIVIPKDPRAK